MERLFKVVLMNGFAFYVLYPFCFGLCVMLSDLFYRRIMLKQLIVLGLLMTCGVAQAKPRKPAVLSSRSGLSSWHDYRNSRMTTASRTYPCGTVIEVCNKANGKCVNVVVKDWGPASWTGRQLDLNKAAFSKIAKPGTGQIRVTYRVLKIGHEKELHRH